MVLVEHDAVMVLATSVTATARMLPVLADTSVAGTDMAPLLTVLAETCTAANTVVEASTIASRTTAVCQGCHRRGSAARPPACQRLNSDVLQTAKKHGT